MRTKGCVALLALLMLSAQPSGETDPSETDLAETDRAGIDVVVLDPGHGGADFGARGASGGLEKGVALGVAKRIGSELEGAGFRVVYTRSDDSFVTLAERTEIANRSGGDLFLSVHANSAPDAEAAGFETYFLSLDASDDEARRVATAENGVFGLEGSAPDSGNIVGDILGDMIRTRHLRVSSDVARAIQHNLGELPGSSRGVKQAPFVVLMGVNMPAVLIETGFLTNPVEEGRLARRSHQKAIARAITRALQPFQQDADASADSADSLGASTGAPGGSGELDGSRP
jgi:N-acetylmuramoyl-L-alanine amidase